MFNGKLDLYIPHEHEEVIHELWRNGVKGKEIVKATSNIAIKKDMGIFYTGHGLSDGMAREWEAMINAGRPVVEISEAIPEYSGNPKDISEYVTRDGQWWETVRQKIQRQIERMK